MSDEIFDAYHPRSVLSSIDNIVGAARALERLRENLFRDAINWNFVYEVGIAIAETDVP